MTGIDSDANPNQTAFGMSICVVFFIQLIP